MSPLAPKLRSARAQGSKSQPTSFPGSKHSLDSTDTFSYFVPQVAIEFVDFLKKVRDRDDYIPDIHNHFRKYAAEGRYYFWLIGTFQMELIPPLPSTYHPPPQRDRDKSSLMNSGPMGLFLYFWSHWSFSYKNRSMGPALIGDNLPPSNRVVGVSGWCWVVPWVPTPFPAPSSSGR